MINTLKALLIVNAHRERPINNAKKGWSDAARKKAAMKRKFTAKKAGGGKARSGGMFGKSKKKLDFYEARRKAGMGARLIEDQVKRAYDYRETSTELAKTKPKASEKYLNRADKLDGMISRNEKKLKKLIKKYGIDKNPS